MFFIPQNVAPASRQRIRRRAVKLAAFGFQLWVCDDAPGLLQRVCRAGALAVSTVAVLAGDQAQNTEATRALRTSCPHAGILVLLHAGNDDACIQALHSGADAHCPATVSMPLLVALLFSLLRRLTPAANHPSARDPTLPGTHACARDLTRAGGDTSARDPTPLAAHMPMVVADDHGWSLHDGGSVLMAPAGGRIPLTTGERAFMATLLEADGLRAPHRELIDAVNACYAAAAPRTHQARLGVLISRLRRKVKRYGYDMPLKSVHNWGYMFTGRVPTQSARSTQPGLQVP